MLHWYTIANEFLCVSVALKALVYCLHYTAKQQTWANLQLY